MERMRRFVAFGWMIVLALPLALAGCASASWDTATKSPAYAIPREIPIWVDISAEVERADTGGYSSTLVQTMESELIALGYEPRIFTPSVGGVQDVRHLPRAEILIRFWNQGSAVAGIVPHVGQPELAVECVVLSAANQQIFKGRLSASQTDSDWADPRTAAHTAEIAGKLVGRTLAGR
jgi:hypothetical protein